MHSLSEGLSLDTLSSLEKAEVQLRASMWNSAIDSGTPVLHTVCAQFADRPIPLTDDVARADKCCG